MIRTSTGTGVLENITFVLCFFLFVSVLRKVMTSNLICTGTGTSVLENVTLVLCLIF
jgi:hypothetical protein